MVRPDTVFHLCSRFDGEWYATITARSDVKDADPIVAIAGPFADLEQAKAHNGQCMELSRRNRQFYLVDMPSVPPKARQHDVRRGWRQGDFGRLRSWRGGDDLRRSYSARREAGRPSRSSTDQVRTDGQPQDR